MARIGVDGRVLVDRYHGIGRVTFELLGELSSEPGIELVIFVDPTEPATRIDLDPLRARSNVRFVDFPVRLPSIAQFLRWPAAIRAQRVDVMLYPYPLGAPLVAGGRHVTIVHDCIFEHDSAFAPGRRAAAAHRLMTRVLLRRSTVVTPSRATASDVRRHYGVSVPDEHVVEWGVGSDFANAADNGDTAPRPIAQRYLLHVGARRPHKNVPLLVRALAQLDDALHLMLVGSADPRWTDETAELAESLGVADRVHEVSGVSDDELRGLYAHAEAFVYPSLIEGFGLPLLESMAAGTPVVASDIPVFSEIGSDAAELVQADDPARWATAVERLGDGEHRDALVQRGQSVARAATWRQAAARMGAVLTETARVPSTRLRVLQSFTPDRGDLSVNPYTDLLEDSLRPLCDVHRFTWPRALRGDYDVFHTHWPEHLIGNPRRLRRTVAQVLFAVLLVVLRVRRIAVVRTMHNVAPHRSPSAVSNLLLRRLDAMVGDRIYLHRSDDPDAVTRAHVLPHGDYGDWYAGYPHPDRQPGRLVYFGRIHPYKNVDGLLRAFRETPAELSLVVAGSVQDAALADEIRGAAAGDPRIELLLRPLSDADLCELIGTADAVVLPYEYLYNSGSMLLALTLGRPVIAPRSGMADQMVDEVGASWVACYDGALDAAKLTEAYQALAAAAAGRDSGPHFRDRDWKTQATQLEQVYREAVADRRGQTKRTARAAL